MTREERVSRMQTLRSEAEELVRDYNQENQEGHVSEAFRIAADLEQKINEYGAESMALCFEEVKATEDPMLEAVKRLTYPAIAVKDEKVGESEIIVRTVIDRDRPIDLLRLDKFCGGIGHDKNWAHIAQKMNFLLTAQKCIDLGISPKAVNDSYSMSEIAREFDMGKNPTSKTNLLRTLQTVVTAMLGEGYKATSHDVNFLLSVFAKKNRKALTVTCANHKNFRGYIAEICHRIVTGKPYVVEFKQKKEG